jgi:putative DNA primase/helicase
MSRLLAFDEALDLLESRGCQPRLTGEDQAYAKCPAHDDQKPSLSITRADDDAVGVLLCCHAGCEFAEITAELRGAGTNGYRPDPARLAKVKSKPRLRFEASVDYHYLAADGTRLLKQRGVLIDPETGEVVVAKTFRWWWLCAGKWSPGDGGHKPTLYRSEAVDHVRQFGGVVYVVEGEKDVESLRDKAIPAVSPAHGAGAGRSDGKPDMKWLSEWTEQLHDLDRLAVIADDDQEGRKHADAVAAYLVEDRPDRPVPVYLCAEGCNDASDHLEAGHGLDELRVMSEDQKANKPERFVRLSTVKPERIRWFWRDYVPAKRLTVVEGDPGEMKSTLCIYFCAQATVGGSMPDGTPGLGPMNVLFISAEDNAADTIHPRMKAAGADVERAFVLGPDDDRLLSFPDDTSELETFIDQHQIGLVVLDPLNAFLADSVRTNTDHSVRRALAPLGRMAERTGVTMLVIRHLTKAGGNNPLLRGQGSIAFIGAVRAGLLVATKEGDPELRYVASNKHSLAATPATWTFRPEPVPNLDTVRISWADKAEETTAADLLVSAEQDEDRTTMTGECADHVRAYLEAEGESEATAVLRSMRANGYPEWSTHRARKKLKVLTRRVGFGKGGKWMWSLPDTDPGPSQPPIDDAEASIDDIDSASVSALSMQSMDPIAFYGEPEEAAKQAPLDRSPTHCRTCGQRLLLALAGRDQCEKCRLAEQRGTTP